jgi:uncharacterized protein YdaU (DUF1376 family)
MGLPWIAFYWRDHIAATGHLSLIEQGAYFLLMAHYYITAQPLPADLEQLHRIGRCTNDEEKRAIERVLRWFFERSNTGYEHPRIDVELAKAAEISSKRRDAAKAMHRKYPASAVARAEHLQTQSQPQGQEQSPSNKKALSARSARAGGRGKSRGRPSDTAGKHSRIKQLIFSIYREHNKTDPPWDGSEGKQLDLLLKATPGWTEEQYRGCLQNLYASDGYPSGQRPRVFMKDLSTCLNGPLDRFRRTRREISETGCSKADARERERDRKYQLAAEQALSRAPQNGGGLPDRAEPEGNRSLAGAPEAPGKILSGGNHSRPR